MTPRATYRLQFHRDFPFAAAQALVPYFRQLGISHIYASPITTARSGSQHGYDVVDPTRVNPELGGEAGLRSLVAELRSHGMGLMMDIVPNHMGVAGGENPWWNDVLAHGQASSFAHYFDIDWSERLLLPILGTPLEEALAQGAIAIDHRDGQPELCVYAEHRLPLRPEDHDGLPDTLDSHALKALLDRQHYRLGWWRTADDELNWRRFFTINELAGLRIEEPEVFDAVHALPLRLWREGLVDGVRIDHVDGLTDPAGYCRTLRARLAAEPRVPDAPSGPAYIVVEKILGPGESLPADWDIDGTSGYDFMEQASALLHDPDGEAPLRTVWNRFAGRPADFAPEELRARQDMLSWAFSSQLSRCVDGFVALAASARPTSGYSRAMLHRAIERLLWVFPVYRTYGTGSQAPASDADIRDRARRAVAAFVPPGESGVVDAILCWLAGEGPGRPDLCAEAVRRFQQLSAPIAAKAVEDTAFYRHGPLLSRTDVGFDAARFAIDVDAFHRLCGDRAAHYPRAMLATATHDHKRGEDVRARLAVLSSIPDIWEEQLGLWDGLANGPSSGIDPGDRYMAYQMLLGTWPDGLEPDDRGALATFGERLCAWQQKALREAKLRSSWQQPDEQYEARTLGWIAAICDPARSPELLGHIHRFVLDTQSAAQANSLVQTALRYTVPGVPDLYQGTELPDFSMVDPDNRTPVDYALREAMLAGSVANHPKLDLIRTLLSYRNKAPDVFAASSYEAATVTGIRRDHVLGFSRRCGESELRCAVLLRSGRMLFQSTAAVPAAEWWGDTMLTFPGSSEPVPAGEIFTDRPVVVDLVT
ncbi:malto-oligosyltrehalose synthase [Blastomonas sp.]|uniref:malto-oligosyltrehalose synthase n=1 Tax=Blastomonas sp. TaxID=1909299 RepID=UPI00391DDCA6